MSKFILPYAFRGISLGGNFHFSFPGRVIDRIKSTQYLGEGVHKQFSMIYSDVLQAISENDQEYLAQVMEKKLYNRTIEGISQIRGQGLNINYIEDNSKDHEEIFYEVDEEDRESNEKVNLSSGPFDIQGKLAGSFYKENDMKIHLLAHAVFGAKINREENIENVLELAGRFSSRQYFVNFKNLMSLYHDQIICLDVKFQTTRKLYITNNDGEVVHGDDSLKKEISHIWRFESYCPNLDWVLTDMDAYLDGNRYFPPKNSESK